MRLFLAILITVFVSKLSAQNILSFVDEKNRVFFLDAQSRVKFKLKSSDRTYKGTVFAIGDSSLIINGEPIKFQRLDFISFKAPERGYEIASYSVLAVDALSIVGGAATGGIVFAITGVVGGILTPFAVGYIIYHAVTKRRFSFDDHEWAVIPEKMRKVKRRAKKAVEYTGSGKKKVIEYYGE